MGTTIDAVATSRSRNPFGNRALRLADRAARDCLHDAGRTSGELDVLINAGIYRDKNLAEPALAALIQEDIGANPGHPPVAGHGTFSFDVDNGACGVLTAAFLLDAFLRSGAIRLGMTVTSDVDPGRSRGYRFAPVGGALLVGWDDAIPGLGDFQFETFPEHQQLFESRVSWEGRRGLRLSGRLGGRQVLSVQERRSYASECLGCAQVAIEKYAANHGLVVQDLDLVMASGPSADFPEALADRLAIPTGRFAQPTNELRGAHTAGPIAALEAARRSGQLEAAQNVLWVAAGAGITVALARYRGTAPA
jgi:3-oxoacyl-[acyl-carrier-protein] synthase III